MLIKINKEGEKVLNLSFGSDEPEPVKEIPKPEFIGSAERARIAAAEAAKIVESAEESKVTEGSSAFMELYGGYYESESSNDNSSKSFY